MSIAILLALTAVAPEVPATSVQAVQEGPVWVMRNLIDDNPLYTFDQDEPGDQDKPAKSNCNDACAAAFRPLTVFGSDGPIGKWTPITRADGSSQWAFDGKPVYSFARDPEPVAASNGNTGSWQPLTLPAR